jgi:hypothetical protein
MIGRSQLSLPRVIRETSNKSSTNHQMSNLPLDDLLLAVSAGSTELHELSAVRIGASGFEARAEHRQELVLATIGILGGSPERSRSKRIAERPRAFVSLDLGLECRRAVATSRLRARLDRRDRYLRCAPGHEL